MEWTLLTQPIIERRKSKNEKKEQGRNKNEAKVP